MTRNEKKNLDMKIESNIAQFLDKNFWSQFPYGYKRQTEKEFQFAGIDITVASKSDLSIHFDEKAKIYGCLNSILQCPSFEISFLNRAYEIQDGWFCQNLSTDYYAYIAVYADTENINDLSAENIISACDMLWVKKKDVVDYVQQHIDLSALQEDAKELRVEGDEQNLYKHRRRYKGADFWLTYSRSLYEKPVNLVIPRNRLEKLKNTKHFKIYKNEIQRV